LRRLPPRHKLRGEQAAKGRSMSLGLWILLGVVVLLVIIVIGIYNGLVAGRQEVRNAWSQIDIQLKRRHDLIPNLVNSVKDSMKTEQAQLTAVIAARNQAVSAPTPADAMKAENALTGTLRQLFALVESYPQLRSQQNVSGLMEELSSTENRISFARQHYNDAVQAQNIRVASFPAVLLASSFGFTNETMYQVPEAERAATEAVPEVRLT
jgi:LemA protein